MVVVLCEIGGVPLWQLAVIAIAVALFWMIARGGFRL